MSGLDLVTSIAIEPPPINGSRYSDIILGKITKTRNICDFINESYYIKKINELEETIKKGNQIF